MVYFATRRGAEQGAEYLRHKNLSASAFHGGLKAPIKRDLIDSFLHGELPVVCATNAFGMGIDKDDVRLVVHADVPGSLENYLQEAGRMIAGTGPASCNRPPTGAQSAWRRISRWVRPRYSVR